MTFLSRSIGQAVEIPLAELPQLEREKGLREGLAEAGVIARVAMVTGATRDEWVAKMTVVNKAAQETKNPKKAAPADEQEQEKQLKAWSRAVLEECLVGLIGWAPGLEEVTDPVRLTDELHRIPLVMFALASRAIEEQVPTRRAEKS